MEEFDGVATAAACIRSSPQNAPSAAIIAFPGRKEARLRLFSKALLDVLGELKMSTLFRIVDCGSSHRVEIDEFAAVIVSSASSDLLFQLHLRSGPRVLLVTEDMSMMVDFVRQYGHARLYGSPELQEML